MRLAIKGAWRWVEGGGGGGGGGGGWGGGGGGEVWWSLYGVKDGGRGLAQTPKMVDSTFTTSDGIPSEARRYYLFCFYCQVPRYVMFQTRKC